MGYSRRVLTAVVILVASSVTVNAPADGESGEDGMAVRVMTFNIRYGTAADRENSWPQRRELVFGVLRTHAPDVVGLQEALRFQIDEIREALPAYGEIGVGRKDGETEGEYAAILYRQDLLAVAEHGTFWLSETPEVPGSTSWGNRIPRICTWGRFVAREGGEAFYVFNVHLDHVSQRSRARGVELLVRRIYERPTADAFVITGDFNAGEKNPALRYLRGEIPRAAPGARFAALPSPAVVDTFRVAHPDATNVGTFGGFRGSTSGKKIDYILVPPWVETKEAEILRDEIDGRYPSDHYPLIAALWLPVVRQN